MSLVLSCIGVITCVIAAKPELQGLKNPASAPVVTIDGAAPEINA